MKSRRAAVDPLTIGLIVVLAGLFFGPKIAPMFDGRSKDAAQSVEASQKVEEAVAKATEAERQKGAAAAASLNQMGVAAGQLPDSPQKSFLVREAELAAPLLPPPDPKKLLEAERRRVAYLEGKVELADKLYASAAKENADLLARTAKAEAKAEAAFQARREKDTELVEAAAYARGKDAIIGLFFAIALLCGAGWAYVRFVARRFGMDDIADMAKRAHEGQSALEVIDSVIPDRLHPVIRKMVAAEEAARAAKKAAAEMAAK